MSQAYGPLICCRCDKPIENEAIVVPAFSASGVRPNQHRHPACDPHRPPATPRPQYI